MVFLTRQPVAKRKRQTKLVQLSLDLICKFLFLFNFFSLRIYSQNATFYCTLTSNTLMGFSAVSCKVVVVVVVIVV